MVLVDIAACASFMLVGIPTNIAVIWIHVYSRHKTSLVQNKFPIIFAVVDLTALGISLPLYSVVGRDTNNTKHLNGANFLLSAILEAIFSWQLFTYVTTLLMASIDKFHAVVSPFEYQRHRQRIFNISLTLAFVVNVTIIAFVMNTLYLFYREYYGLAILVSSLIFLIVFVTIVILYLFIVVKIKQSDWKRRQTAPMVINLAMQPALNSPSAVPKGVKGASISKRSNRRHMVAVKQVVLIMAANVISFVPLLLIGNEMIANEHLFYVYFINHISNFFIYVIISRDFRAEVQRLICNISKTVGPHNSPGLTLATHLSTQV